jgi:hypothetical protein
VEQWWLQLRIWLLEGHRGLSEERQELSEGHQGRQELWPEGLLEPSGEHHLLGGGQLELPEHREGGGPQEHQKDEVPEGHQEPQDEEEHQCLQGGVVSEHRPGPELEPRRA